MLGFMAKTGSFTAGGTVRMISAAVLWVLGCLPTPILTADPVAMRRLLQDQQHSSDAEVSRSAAIAIGVGSGVGGMLLATVIILMILYLCKVKEHRIEDSAKAPHIMIVSGPQHGNFNTDGEGKEMVAIHNPAFPYTDAANTTGLPYNLEPQYDPASIQQLPSTPLSLTQTNIATKTLASVPSSYHSLINQSLSTQTTTVVSGILPGSSVTVDDLARLASLEKHDTFLNDIAHHYRWGMSPPGNAVGVEEGVNAARKAASVMMGHKWMLPTDAPGPPPVELTPAQVFQQLELMATGLVGKGSTALVFKALWPSKFGNKGLVAVKCFKDPSSANLQHIKESFIYEADLLSRCRHPNIIRVYGYCKELPTMCIIMELMPSSLRSKLHGWRGSNNESNTMSAHLTKHVAMFGQDSTATYHSPMLTGPLSHTTKDMQYIPGGGSGSSVYASGQDGGSTQQQQVHNPGPLSPVEVLQLVIGIVSGLVHLHSTPENRPADAAPVEEQFQVPLDEPALGEASGPPQLARVAHRDLKPANILINSKGVPKISDFGLAREHQSTTVYTEHQGAGTVRYMAPELLQGTTHTRLTDKIDIYSLGVMMWEIGMRAVPWDGSPDLQVASWVQEGKRPPLPGSRSPDGRVVDTPPDSIFKANPKFGVLISSCWQAKPERRPKAQVALGLLQELLQQQTKGK